MSTYAKKMKEGMKIIDSIINTTNEIERLCIIFDIDETLIDKQGRIIKPILELYHYALKKKINTIIITARVGLSNNIKNTISELEKNDIKNYDLLYFRPEYMRDVKEFKTFARRNVNECGYIPLFSIGDMYWDVGEYGGIPLLIG